MEASGSEKKSGKRGWGEEKGRRKFGRRGRRRWKEGRMVGRKSDEARWREGNIELFSMLRLRLELPPSLIGSPPVLECTLG